MLLGHQQQWASLRMPRWIFGYHFNNLILWRWHFRDLNCSLGLRCSVCADNFYGNPEIPGGKCLACDCSNNWNFNDTGNCDASTGKCLKCLFNTEGDRCEICKSGYFGDAINDHCKVNPDLIMNLMTLMTLSLNLFLLFRNALVIYLEQTLKSSHAIEQQDIVIAYPM